MLNILSRQQDIPSLDLRYIVPFEWWVNVVADNPQIQKAKDLIISEPLHFDLRIETIEANERQSFIRLVSQKSNYLQIDNFVLNPRLKTATRWKTVSKKIMELLKKKQSTTNVCIPLIYHQNIQTIENSPISINQNDQFKIIKLLICSFTQNHLIYGYINKKAQIKKVLKEMIAFFQYFYTENTKVTFLESNEFRNYKFEECNNELESKSQLIMVHGLQRYDQKLSEYLPKSQFEEFDIQAFQSPRLTRISRNGEELTMADQDSLTMSQHTMSTGAETPFTFGIEDQDWDMFRPYQNYALFGQRLQQEIQHMKQYAREAILTDIIQMPVCSVELMINQLNRLAEDIQQNIERKKIYQKEIAKDTKQYYKDLKETHYSLYTKDKDILVKQSKDLFSKKYQCEQKTKENSKAVIYFSMGNQNN